MKVIWKYPLNIADMQEITLSASARPLTVQLQSGQIVLWVIVDANLTNLAKLYRIAIVGTGNFFDHYIADWTYIGTVQMTAGALVWHVFLEPE